MNLSFLIRVAIVPNQFPEMVDNMSKKNLLNQKTKNFKNVIGLCWIDPCLNNKKIQIFHNLKKNQKIKYNYIKKLKKRN